MIVSRSSFSSVLQALSAHSRLALDTETTGLRPYAGDRLFSIVISVGEWMDPAVGAKGPPFAFYFNFQPYPGLEPDLVLGAEHLARLQGAFADPHKTWYLHNAKYDLAILLQEGIELAGPIHCTQALARVERNDYMTYSLDACLKRDLGMSKDDKVKAYIKDQKLWTDVPVPGRKDPDRRLHFDRVPFDLVGPYAEQDANGTYLLGEFQNKSLSDQSRDYPVGVKTLQNIAEMERALTKTVFAMERVGVKIDRKYCERAAKYEDDQIKKAAEGFKQATGREYAASPKLFAEVFGSDKERWQLTEKGNPSFTYEVLQGFQNPAARALLDMRDAESRYRFYTGFLYHADREDVVHPNFNPGGTDTGRFSSSEPNFQNLTSEEGDEEKEFLVRRAIVPRPGFVFIMPDYDQVEYRMMLDYAKHMAVKNFQKRGLTWSEDYFEVANKVRDGFDIHQATADLVGVTRKQAKTLNFGLLYGMGKAKLAKALGVSDEEGGRIKSRYFAALPYVELMVAQVQETVKQRGWIRNWAGRKYNFPDRGGAFRAPNKLIQGGSADVLKHAMNSIHRHQLREDTLSRMVLTIHDELPCEVHESEAQDYPKQVKLIMEEAYPHHYVPLTVGMEWSEKSLADKKKGFP